MFYIYNSGNPNINISIVDLFLVPLLIFIFIAQAKSTKKYKEMPLILQKNYINGLYVKLFATITFCMVHTFYYGGDTHMYFGEMLRLKNLALQNFSGYLDILFNGNNAQTHLYFNSETGFPMRGMWNDPKTYMVPRILSPLSFICLESYMIASLLLSRIIYSGLWRLYKVLHEVHPNRSIVAAWAILFTPSVLFWGSGILKDSICLAAVGFYTYSFYTIFLKNKINFISIISLIISVWVLIAIKPYVFVAVLPGSMLWLSFGTIKNIQNPFFRTLSIPLILGITYLGFTLIFSSFSENLGSYGTLDSMVKKAKITKDDHTRTFYAYSENYYDVGEMDGSLGGAINKAPQSIIAGLFRPFVWEARNPFIFISGLENLILLILFGRMLFKTGFIKTFTMIFNDPLLFFCFIFAIFFAYSVGLATANFGALVRLRTPMVPFFVYLILYLNQIGVKKEKDESIISKEKKTLPYTIKK